MTTTTTHHNHHPSTHMRRRWLALAAAGCLLAVAGCGSDSGESAEVRDMRLVYDGTSCDYEGGDALAAGPVSVEFDNQSDHFAAMNMVRHAGDETIADMLEYMGDEPSVKHAPPWSRDVRDVWRPVAPGDTYRWDGDLEASIHTLVCARIDPLGVYFGAGLTVTE